MRKSNTHIQPKYNLEFKKNATKVVLENGYTQQAADHLGMSLRI